MNIISSLPEITLEPKEFYLPRGSAGSVQLAQRALKENNFEAAKLLLENVINKGPLTNSEYPYACYTLGFAYLKGGENFPSDSLKALELLQKSGLSEANYYAGMLLLNGSYGIAAQPQAALHCLKEASSQGHALASYALSLIYFTAQEGKNFDKNKVEAYFEKIRAAFPDSESGPIPAEEDAMQSLAISYLQKAADANHIPSQYCLGLIYGAGKGVPQDFTKAEKYLKQASNNGLQPANRALSKLQQKVEVNKRLLEKSAKKSEETVAAPKSFLNRTWKWIKGCKDFLITTSAIIGISAVIIGGSWALTVAFPHIMIPFWIGLGICVVAVGGFCGVIGYAIAIQHH